MRYVVKELLSLYLSQNFRLSNTTMRTHLTYPKPVVEFLTFSDRHSSYLLTKSKQKREKFCYFFLRTHSKGFIWSSGSQPFLCLCTVPKGGRMKTQEPLVRLRRHFMSFSFKNLNVNLKVIRIWCTPWDFSRITGWEPLIWHLSSKTSC